MPNQELFDLFFRFGLAALLGFLLGLERDISSHGQATVGARDFILFALLGALTAFVADRYGQPLLAVLGLLGLLGLLLANFWLDRSEEPGITTELAAIVTFFLGALVLQGATEIAIALAILVLAVLFMKREIKAFGARVQMREMQAVLLLLVLTFIILPVLPQQTLDTLLTVPLGTVTEVEATPPGWVVTLEPVRRVSPGEVFQVYAGAGLPFGELRIQAVTVEQTVGLLAAETVRPWPGLELRSRFGIEFIAIMLSALKPYTLWLIVILVSFVSFIGYVLIKLLGGSVGIGLTGLIGGLVSSTVTTLSFARRSRENPGLNAQYAVAVVLAGSIMFPRLLVQIGIVNPTLAAGIALPLGAMGLAGLAVAGFYFYRFRHYSAPTAVVPFENPFSLKAALSFALLFSAILMLTRLATAYLGSAWLPVVAIVSGLTDADAIAFSLSASQQAGLISVEWAGFNLVLGALANTLMKLLLVLGLGDRGLFKYLLAAFALIGSTGLAVVLLYYDWSALL